MQKVTSEIKDIFSGARLAMKSGELESAQELYKQVIQHDANHVEAHWMLARIATDKDNIDEALKHWTTLRELRPDLGESDLRLARIYKSMNRIPEALEAYGRAKISLPEHPEPRIMESRLGSQTISASSESAISLEQSSVDMTASESTTIEDDRNNFSLIDPRIRTDIDEMLESQSITDDAKDNKRVAYLNAALDQKRLMQQRLAGLEQNPAKAEQAKIIKQVLSKMNWEEYRNVQDQNFTNENINFQRDLLKYLDFDFWFATKFNLANSLGLNNRDTPLRVFDIGVGPGHFPLLCQEMGNSVAGIDVDFSEQTDKFGNSHFYDCFMQLFDLDRITHRIEPYEPLPDLGGRFDLVTALMARFNGCNNTIWGVSEWKYFLCDLKENVLADSARIYFKLAWDSASPETLAYFETLGATVDRSSMVVKFEDTDVLSSTLLTEV